MSFKNAFLKGCEDITTHVGRSILQDPPKTVRPAVEPIVEILRQGEKPAHQRERDETQARIRELERQLEERNDELARTEDELALARVSEVSLREHYEGQIAAKDRQLGIARDNAVAAERASNELCEQTRRERDEALRERDEAQEGVRARDAQIERERAATRYEQDRVCLLVQDRDTARAEQQTLLRENDEMRHERDDARRGVQNLDEQLAQMRRDLDAAREHSRVKDEQHERALGDAQERRRELDELRAQLRDAQQMVGRLKHELTGLRQEVATLQQENHSLTVKVAERTDRAESLRELLQAFADNGRRVSSRQKLAKGLQSGGSAQLCSDALSETDSTVTGRRSHLMRWLAVGGDAARGAEPDDAHEKATLQERLARLQALSDEGADAGGRRQALSDEGADAGGRRQARSAETDAAGRERRIEWAQQSDRSLASLPSFTDTEQPVHGPSAAAFCDPPPCDVPRRFTDRLGDECFREIALGHALEKAYRDQRERLQAQENPNGSPLKEKQQGYRVNVDRDAGATPEDVALFQRIVLGGPDEDGHYRQGILHTFIILGRELYENPRRCWAGLRQKVTDEYDVDKTLKGTGRERYKHPWEFVIALPSGIDADHCQAVFNEFRRRKNKIEANVRVVSCIPKF